MEKGAGRTTVLLAKEGQDTKCRGLFLCTVACSWVRLCGFCSMAEKTSNKQGCGIFSSRKRGCTHRSWSWALMVAYLSLTLLGQGGRLGRTGTWCVLFLQFWVYKVKSGVFDPMVLTLQGLFMNTTISCSASAVCGSLSITLSIHS